MQPRPIPLSAHVFREAIASIKEKLAKLDEVVEQKRQQLTVEQDPMRHAELAREWAEGYWASVRARSALDLISGETMLALQPKIFPHPCAFCLGHYDGYALEHPEALGFLPMDRQQALQEKRP